MDFFGIVALIAVIWYFATRASDSAPPPRTGAAPRPSTPRSPRLGPATPPPRPASPRGANSSFAQQIRSAIDAGRDIRFRYTDAKGRVTTRTIQPRRFVQFEFTHGEGRSLCVEGHCRLRNESRTFALRRMSELQTL